MLLLLLITSEGKGEGFLGNFFQNDYKNTNALQQLCTFTFMIIINLSIDNDLSFIEGGHTPADLKELEQAEKINGKRMTRSCKVLKSWTSLLLFSLLVLVRIVDSGDAPSDTVIVPNGDHNLEFYLCHAEGQNKLIPGTILMLNSSVTHHISLGGSFCVLHNLTDLTILSDSDSSYADVKM